MPTKNTEKKTKVKNPPKQVASLNAMKKDSLGKEEIKEIVTETVEEVLKEQSEKQNNEPLVKENTAGSDTETHESSEPEEVEKKENEEEKKDEAEVSSSTPQPTVMPEASEGMPLLTDDPRKSVISAAPTVDSGPNPTSDTSSAPVVLSSTPSPDIEKPADTMVANPASPKGSSTVKLFIIFLIIGIVIGGGALWYGSSHNLLHLSALRFGASPTPRPSQAPRLTPAVSTAPVDISSYKVSVLNGSGVAGAAAKASSILTSSGFTVVNTGNANTSNFTQTIIEAKSTVGKAALDKLTQLLGKSYVVSPPTLPLDSTQSADIVVTIGSSTK